MNDLQIKIENWYKKLTAKKISYTRNEVRPTHDWEIIMTITFVIVIFIVIFGFYSYAKISSGKLFTATGDSSVNEVKINTDLLNKTIGDLRAREENLIKIKSGAKVPADPSL